MLELVFRLVSRIDTKIGTKKENASNTNGEVSEWFKVQTWNVCVGATPPGVRIPPSPF